MTKDVAKKTTKDVARKTAKASGQRQPPTDESPEERAKRAKAIVRRLKRAYPDADCELIYNESGYELLVATILAAQCTDARVNTVTPALHAAFPGPRRLAAAEQEEVEAIVRPTGTFRQKAKNLRAMASQLVESHAAEVPQTVDELTALPGVGRKTAHVVLGTAYGIPTGVVVDTHVRRISTLLGLTGQADPVKIEADLNDLLPKREWIMYSHRIIAHGRTICIARRPKCTECPLLDLCPRIGLEPLAESA